MKRVRTVTHRQVLKRLFRQRGFRQGYKEELAKLWLAHAHP